MYEEQGRRLHVNAFFPPLPYGKFYPLTMKIQRQLKHFVCLLTVGNIWIDKPGSSCRQVVTLRPAIKEISMTPSFNV